MIAFFIIPLAYFLKDRKKLIKRPCARYLIKILIKILFNHVLF